MDNRLNETRLVDLQTPEVVNTYAYDDANRLTGVNGVSYTWDANGNLLADGTSIYSYDHANRLVGVTQGSDVYSFAYLGTGDRIGQTVNGVTASYTLDLNTGLTQVLSDGANTYLYGNGRIAQMNGVDSANFLGDASPLAHPQGCGQRSATDRRERRTRLQ